MHCVVRRLSREWSSASHRRLVGEVVAQRERFVKFSFYYSQTSSDFCVEELRRIFDDNKRDQGLVNHSLYKLLLEEETIRFAHKSVVGNAKDFYERRKLVRGIVNDLADEKFQFEPGNGASHEPPPFRDKVLLEAMRMVLQNIYEPVLLDSSHGFRPARSRHTALKSVRCELRHHTHALVALLDTSHDLDHHVLASLLSHKIGDKRFLRLVRKALKAGHGSRKRHVWTVKNAWDGKKHHDSSTLSTLLSNIYLHSLDTWIRSRKRNFDTRPAMDPRTLNLAHRIARLDREGKLERSHILRARMAQLERLNLKPQTLFYVRHGDELLLSFRARKQQVLDVKQDLEAFLKISLKLGCPEDFTLVRFASNHAFFLGTKISVKNSKVRLEAPMDRIIMELANLGMVSVGGTKPHPVTYLARCSHNEIISYYNWVMRGCCTYYSFVDNFYQLTSYLRLALRSSCVRTLTMKLKRFRSARIYKEFGAELAARYRVPINEALRGSGTWKQAPRELSEEVKALLQERMRAAKRVSLELSEMGEIEKGLLHRFIIPRRREEANGDVYLEFRGDCLLYCSKNTEHEETRRVLRKMELLPPPQNVWDFKEVLVPSPRPRLSVDYESLYPF